MKRRRVLVGVATGSIGAAGCLSDGERSRRGSDSTRPTEIVEHDFETGVKTDATMGDEPEITMTRDESTVTVEGVGEYGSSSCGYLDGREPEYDPERAKLDVSVRAAQDRSADETPCDDDVAASSYRFVIRFDRGIPARIEARHPFGQEATKELQ